MKYLVERPVVSGLIIGLVVGILVGWLGIGWGAWPVAWEDVSPAMLRSDFRDEYVKMTALLYSYTLDASAAKNRMREWESADEQVCMLANKSADPDKQFLLNLAQALTPGIDCAKFVEPAEKAEGRSLAGQIALLCGVGLLAIALVAAAFYLISRQRRVPEAVQKLPPEHPATAPAGAGVRTIPLAQFPTEFNIGHDTYDDSFSIETATGEFLGECGVGISESIGVGAPKKVTACEVWLFDKNDIRTVTKVIMSNHAFSDDALRAKLAPKGEAILAEPGSTVVLETASLIINARIVELEYGTGELPPQSFFNRLVVELAAWAKESPEHPASADNPDEFAL